MATDHDNGSAHDRAVATAVTAATTATDDDDAEALIKVCSVHPAGFLSGTQTDAPSKMSDMMKDPKATEVCRLFAPISTIRTNGPLTNNYDQSEREDSQEEDVAELNQNEPVCPHTAFCIAVPHQLTPYEQERLSLLGLPAEIRNKIYRLVLVDIPAPQGFVVVDDKGVDLITYEVPVPQRVISSLAPPPLTLVNKQLFAEALPMYYAENIFYLLLWGKPRRLGAGGQDPAQFHRFARMAEYFGRQSTSPTDNSPLRHIENIIVQVADTTSEGIEIYRSVADRLPPRRFTYKKLCIRSDQQQITYTSDFEAEEEAFDPTKYRWTVGDATSLKVKNPWFFWEARDLMRISFNGRMESMEGALRRLRSEAKITAGIGDALLGSFVASAVGLGQFHWTEADAEMLREHQT